MILVFNNFQYIFFIVCYSQWKQFDSDDNTINILITSRIFIFIIVTWVNCCLIVVCVAIITIQLQNLAPFVDTCWISVGLLPPSITFQRNQKVHHSVDLLGILWAIPCHSHHLILSQGIHPITCQAAMASEDGSMGRSLSSTFFLRSHGIQNSIWFGDLARNGPPWPNAFPPRCPLARLMVLVIQKNIKSYLADITPNVTTTHSGTLHSKDAPSQDNKYNDPVNASTYVVGLRSS